jgi:hypothetical protein
MAWHDRNNIIRIVSMRSRQRTLLYCNTASPGTSSRLWPAAGPRTVAPAVFLRRVERPEGAIEKAFGFFLTPSWSEWWNSKSRPNRREPNRGRFSLHANASPFAGAISLVA